MGFKSRLLILASAAIAPGTVWAQAVPAVGTGSPAADLGGSISIDLITIRSASPGLPLRHGSIIPGSERVEYNGEVLNKGRDYQIDYEAGVIYLMRPQKIGQTVRVTSRYEKSKQQESVQTMNFKSSLPTYRFDLAPGLHARLGLGFAERQADGNVLMSNVYGVDTNFGGLNGFMLVGERSKTDARSEYEYQAAPGETPTGKSTAILQKFQK